MECQSPYQLLVMDLGVLGRPATYKQKVFLLLVPRLAAPPCRRASCLQLLRVIRRAKHASPRFAAASRMAPLRSLPTVLALLLYWSLASAKIALTNDNIIIVAEQPFTITWQDNTGPVTILLSNGPDTILQHDEVINCESAAVSTSQLLTTISEQFRHLVHLDAAIQSTGELLRHPDYRQHQRRLLGGIRLSMAWLQFNYYYQADS
jgi:hypothetical protein